MKKTIILIFFLMLIPFACAIEINNTGTNVESQYADLYVSVLKYEPYPVGPGEYFNLWLEIENKGLKDAENVAFTLEPSYPFLIDASESAVHEIPQILSHSSTILHYKVRVNENAIEGESRIGYSYSINSKKPVEDQVTVLVQTLKAILSVKDVKTSSEVVEPGETTEISITLRNDADSYLKYITASMQLIYSSLTSFSASATSGTFIELPFTPIGNGNERSIYQIAPHQEATFNFSIVADPDAEIKPYKIPVNINYFDELGKNYSKLELVGVIVGSAPDVYAIVDSTNLQGERQSGQITIKFVNKGTSPIKFLNVKLNQSNDYKIVSSDQSYIGKIDSDDYDTATFQIYLTNLENGKADIPISYEFMDGNNNQYSVNASLLLEIHSAAELGKGGGGAWAIIFAIIIIVVIYLAYRRWGKKRKKKS